MEGLRGKGIQADKVVYLWEGEGFGEGAGEAESSLERVIYSIYSLTRALMDGKPKGEVKVLCVSKGEGLNPLISGISGFGKSVNLENPKFKYKVISLGSTVSTEDMVKVIGEEFGSWRSGVEEVKYEGGKRYERKLKEVEIKGMEGAAAVLKEGGVYVITGGMGGLGAIFGRYLSKEYKAKLVLSDVRDLDSKGEGLLEEIGVLGGEAHYVRCDVTKREDVEGAGKEGQGAIWESRWDNPCSGSVARFIYNQEAAEGYGVGVASEDIGRTKSGCGDAR